MQSFAPYSSITETAKCLDRQRLGKQRTECIQMLIALDYHKGSPMAEFLHTTYGYKSCAPGSKPPYLNHPATLMWRGHEGGLAHYGLYMCDEWARRGYEGARSEEVLMHFLDTYIREADMPEWWGREDIHASHRAALLYKAPEHYAQFGWTETPEYNYIWPTTS